MRTLFVTTALLASSLVSAAETAQLGQPAPGFTLTDLTGAEVSLSDFAGKTVVLEWFNPGCPFVQQAHGPEGVLEKMAAETVSDDVVWLAVNSSAPGKQGHGVKANQEAVATWSMSHGVVVDEKGEVGKLYGAATTPHMYVVDPQGVLVYRGAIDNAPLGKKNGEHVNYVSRALADLKSSGKVTISETKPYGCSVKY